MRRQHERSLARWAKCNYPSLSAALFEAAEARLRAAQYMREHVDEEEFLSDADNYRRLASELARLMLYRGADE